MSFSLDTKLELCKINNLKGCCEVSEMYGILLFSKKFNKNEIRISTENKVFVKRILKLMSRAFDIDSIDADVTENVRTVISINNENIIKKIFSSLGYDYRIHISMHLNRNIIEKSCCISSFLRGIFLCSGYVSAPDKKPHLEISTTHKTLSREIVSLMMDVGISPKLISREGKEVLYFKDSKNIEMFLTYIGASSSVLMIMEEKINREYRNSVNRQVNCETFNIVRSIDASAKQVAAITEVISKYGESIFPDSLIETVNVRLKYPELSLKELAVMFDPPITKSGINHRMRKIMHITRGVFEK